MLKRKLLSVTNSILLFVSVILLFCYLSLFVGVTSYNSVNSKEHRSAVILENTLKDLINCTNKQYKDELYQSGSFWILKNYIRAEGGPTNCYDTITYTTQSDVKYIDHLIPIVQRFVEKFLKFLHKNSKIWELFVSNFK